MRSTLDWLSTLATGRPPVAVVVVEGLGDSGRTYPRVVAFVAGVGCLVGRWMLWVGCCVCAAVRPLCALTGLREAPGA